MECEKKMYEFDQVEIKERKFSFGTHSVSEAI